jgi:hypothetical protein
LRYGSSRTTGLYLSSAGNVGIGTTNPSQKLEVGGNIMIPNYSALKSRSTGNASVNLIYLGNDDIIKIGNDSVPIKLQGEVTIANGLTTNNSITVYKNAADYTAGWARHTNVRNSADTILSAFGFYGTGDKLEYTYIGPSYASPLVSIRPSGNVGIGVAYPAYKLAVAGTANFSGALTAAGATINGTLNVSSGNVIKIGDATISYENGVLKIDKPLMAKGYAAGATATAN